MSSESVVPAPVFTELSARRLGPLRRFLVRRPRVMDALVAAVFTGWALLMGVGADSMYALHAHLGGDRVLQMQLASLALTAVGAGALLWRRRRPVPVAAAMGVLGVLSLGATGATSGFEVGLALALYAVAASRPPLATWLSFAGSVGAVLLAAWVLPLPATVGALMLGLDPGGPVLSTVWYQAAVPVLLLALLAVATGTSARNRRLHLAGFVEAANALARDRDQQALLARAAERARIAREMHDVVAHSVSVMVALGGGASAALERSPERTRAALDELVATGRSALGDMRRVLGVLDEDDPAGVRAAGSTDAAPLEPLPGSLDLTALVDRFRTAGLPVRATGLGGTEVPEQDSSLQLAVYRIVQESLTNVLRHAPGTPRVEVGVHDRPDGVEVVVTDHGATVPVERVGSLPGAGRGLVGMRERAAVFGGTVEAGPVDVAAGCRGWRVRALLPTLTHVPGEGRA